MPPTTTLFAREFLMKLPVNGSTVMQEASQNTCPSEGTNVNAGKELGAVMITIDGDRFHFFLELS